MEFQQVYQGLNQMQLSFELHVFLFRVFYFVKLKKKTKLSSSATNFRKNESLNPVVGSAVILWCWRVRIWTEKNYRNRRTAGKKSNNRNPNLVRNSNVNITVSFGKLMWYHCVNRVDVADFSLNSNIYLLSTSIIYSKFLHRSLSTSSKYQDVNIVWKMLLVILRWNTQDMRPRTATRALTSLESQSRFESQDQFFSCRTYRRWLSSQHVIP